VVDRVCGLLRLTFVRALGSRASHGQGLGDGFPNPPL
jgi:hypothetical protein